MYPLQFLINYILHGTIAMSGFTNDPFIRDLKKYVLNRSTVFPEFGILRDIKKSIMENDHLMEMNDMGAGTKLRQKKKRIGSIAKVSSVNSKYGELLYRIAFHYKPDRIIEFGTALGISTMYLAMGNPNTRVITVEGNAQLAQVASKNFSDHGFKNITLINKPFDNVIDQIMAEKHESNLVFIDGNHTYDATLRYFEAFKGMPGSTSILLFDDINWSTGMMKAWKLINQSPEAGIVVDLFHMGILFRGWESKGNKFRLCY